jgi:hypothetical protein
MSADALKKWHQFLNKFPAFKLISICVVVFWTTVLLYHQNKVRETLHARFSSSTDDAPSTPHTAPAVQQPFNYPPSAALEPSNLTFVHRLLKVEAPFHYQCLTVNSAPSSGQSRTHMQMVDQAIFHEPAIGGSLEDESVALPPCQPVEIPVPEYKTSAEVDTGSLFFGAATSLDRIINSTQHWARWLAGTEATAIVIVHWDPIQEPEIQSGEHLRETSKWIEVEHMLERYGLNITLIPYMSFGGGTHFIDDPDTKRHLSITQAMRELKEPRHEWFVIIDDDTFFPSLPNLLKSLNQYDSSKPHFIGQLSESRAHYSHATHMAYGGAGLFLTSSVLERITLHYPTCLDRPRDDENNPKPPGGDMLIKFCIEEDDGTSDVPLEILPGLHQIDIHGDPWGWYESGITNALSLHHYNTYAIFPILTSSYVTDVCGDCFLQRYQFKEDTIMTNGVSIVKYLNGIDRVPFHKVEQTFEVNGPDDYLDSLGELRPPLTEGVAKQSWRFETAVKTEDGIVRQFYVSRANGKNGVEGKPDSVYELIWHDKRKSKKLFHGWKS